MSRTLSIETVRTEYGIKLSPEAVRIAFGADGEATLAKAVGAIEGVDLATPWRDGFYFRVEAGHDTEETRQAVADALAEHLEQSRQSALAAQDTMRITASHGVPFTVRVVPPGGSYGLQMGLTNAGPDSLIEFYDARYADKAGFDAGLGQFVSRYCASTLLSADRHAGINLHGGVPGWQIDGEAMTRVMGWVEGVLARRAAAEALPEPEGDIPTP